MRKLGTKADFEKDVKEVAKEAFTETLEKDHGKEKTKKFVKEVFDNKGSESSWISKIADILLMSEKSSSQIGMLLLMLLVLLQKLVMIFTKILNLKKKLK